MMTSRKARKASHPLSQRDCAALLGISRTKLARMLKDGLPLVRKNDGFIIIDEARKWIAVHEGIGHKRAPVLHPDDPRFRERTAAAAIKAIKVGIKRGRLVYTSDLTEKFKSELIEVRSTLLQNRLSIPELESMTADNAEKIMASMIQDALEPLKLDRPGSWRQPLATPGAPAEDDCRLETRNGEVLPLLMPGDPRHAFASANADMRQHELASLEAEVVPLADALTVVADEYALVRSAVRGIPTRVALDLGASPTSWDIVEEFVRNNVYEVLNELSGQPPEDRGAAVDVDTLPLENVDG